MSIRNGLTVQQTIIYRGKVFHPFSGHIPLGQSEETWISQPILLPAGPGCTPWLPRVMASAHWSTLSEQEYCVWDRSTFSGSEYSRYHCHLMQKQLTPHTAFSLPPLAVPLLGGWYQLAGATVMDFQQQMEWWHCWPSHQVSSDWLSHIQVSMFQLLAHLAEQFPGHFFVARWCYVLCCSLLALLDIVTSGSEFRTDLHPHPAVLMAHCLHLVQKGQGGQRNPCCVGLCTLSMQPGQHEWLHHVGLLSCCMLGFVVDMQPTMASALSVGIEMAPQSRVTSVGMSFSGCSRIRASNTLKSSRGLSIGRLLTWKGTLISRLGFSFQGFCLSRPGWSNWLGPLNPARYSQLARPGIIW